jgi:hypothetical protein
MKLKKKWPNPDAGTHDAVIYSVQEITIPDQMRTRIEVTFRVGEGSDMREIEKTYKHRLDEDSPFGEFLSALDVDLQVMDDGDEFDTDTLIGRTVKLTVAPMPKGVYVASVSSL